MPPFTPSSALQLLVWALVVGFGFTLGASAASSLIALLKRP